MYLSEFVHANMFQARRFSFGIRNIYILIFIESIITHTALFLLFAFLLFNIPPELVVESNVEEFPFPPPPNMSVICVCIRKTHTQQNKEKK